MQYQLELTQLTLIELLELQSHVEQGVLELDENNKQKLDEYLERRSKAVADLYTNLDS
jgi:hypothetical protein